MHWDQLSFLNPNYFYGCHPFNLRSYFEGYIDPPYDSVNSSLSQGRKNEFVLLWFLFTFFNRLFYTENLIVLSLYL
jgi:hypothetical protein